MSAPMPPHGGAWTPPPARPRRRRPSAWWFAVGALLIAGAVVSLGFGILTAVGSVADFVKVDATVPGDGRPHVVTVPTDGDRMLWREAAHPGGCDVVDTSTGAAVRLRTVGADYRREDGSGDWVGVARFDPGSGRLEVTCPAGGGRGQIGPSAEISHVVKSLLLVVLAPLVLGGLGTVALIVTGILWATGAPRHDDSGPGDTVVRSL
jgi:hypothetical protein